MCFLSKVLDFVFLRKNLSGSDGIEGKVIFENRDRSKL